MLDTTIEGRNKAASSVASQWRIFYKRNHGSGVLANTSSLVKDCVSMALYIERLEAELHKHQITQARRRKRPWWMRWFTFGGDP